MARMKDFSMLASMFAMMATGGSPSNYFDEIKTSKPTPEQYKILSTPEKMSKKRKAILKKQNKL